MAEFASKGVAGAALGTGIAGLSLGILNGVIDEKMMAIYNYEHEKAIEKATEIKIMQEMYKK